MLIRYWSSDVCSSDLTLECLVSSQVLFHQTAMTTSLRGEILITDHHTTLRILPNLVQQTLLETVMGPCIHCTCDLPVDLPGFVSCSVLCLELRLLAHTLRLEFWKKYHIEVCYKPFYELARSEVRRVGKECVRTCRSRW